MTSDSVTESERLATDITLPAELSIRLPAALQAASKKHRRAVVGMSLLSSPLA